MAPSAEIFFEHDKWGRNLLWSAVLHVAFTAAVVTYATVFPGGSGANWGAGGGGEAMGVTLVSSVPLPANPAPAENVLANESKGLAESQPKPEEKAPEAIEIPDRETKVKKPKPQVSATRRKPEPQPV